MSWATSSDSTVTAPWLRIGPSLKERATTSVLRLSELAAPPPAAMPRSAQLERLAEQPAEGRVRASRLERSRFGWYDAPRRPCYRRTRLR